MHFLCGHHRVRFESITACINSLSCSGLPKELQLVQEINMNDREGEYFVSSLTNTFTVKSLEMALHDMHYSS